MFEKQQNQPHPLVSRFKSRPDRFVRQIKSNARFIKNWLEHPGKTGAVAPSGNLLAQRMASFVPVHSTLPVLEIGPGTGAVTRALLEAGIAPERLVALEYNQDFCAHLKERFPNISIIQGDAYALQKTLTSHFGEVPRFSAIVSSLPLLNSPREKRVAVLREALDHMVPGGPYIQFSYGINPPIEVSTDIVRPVTMSKTGWIMRNIPPARVFVYR